MFWSLVPLAHALAFGSMAVVLRLVTAYRRDGTVPQFLFNATDSARDFTARWFYVWLPLADLVLVILHACSKDPSPPLLPGFYWTEALRWSGLALLAASLIWVVCAQLAMGREWRMGVDEQHDGHLLTTGLFALSRHPVYTGIRITLFAQLIVMESWATFCIWVTSELLVQLQARFEEEAMVVQYGVAYRTYCAAVRRWL